MTSRDIAWRAGGLALVVGTVAAGHAHPAQTSGAVGLASFVLAMAGLVLLIQGKRVPLSLRIERSRHRELPEAIRARYRARLRQR